MKKSSVLFFFIICCHSAFSFEKALFVGPQFYYTNIEFNNPSNIEGYAGGLTGGFWLDWNCLFTKVFFEGNWNASRIVGDPCQISSINEYYLQGEMGKDFTLCNICVRPYVGFGWDRYENIQEPRTASLCYRYDKLFIPLGWYLTWKNCTDIWSLQFEWRPDVWSQLDLLSVHLDPDWGYAFRTQLIYTSICYTRCGCLYLSWVPFFDWNRFGKSTLTNSWGADLEIPSLTRWNLGLRFLIEYKF